MRSGQRSGGQQAFERPAVAKAAPRRARPGASMHRPYYAPDGGRSTDPRRTQQAPQWRVAPRKNGLERTVLKVSTLLVAIGALSCVWLLRGNIVAPPAELPPDVTIHAPPLVSSAEGRHRIAGETLLPATYSVADAGAIATVVRPGAEPYGESGLSASAIIARGFSAFETRTRQARTTTRGDRAVVLAHARPAPSPQVAATKPAADNATTMKLAALEKPAAQPSTKLARGLTAMIPDPSRIMVEREPKTTLVSFDTAPFPYHGTIPGSGRPFLDAGSGADRGHTNFRGRVFRESTTFNDSRVLLHIPAGFNPNKPAVMVVFFHGHGATLARDVRDRQQVPAQISRSGVNAVLVAPQFAVDAADSSSGKFWEQNGFRRFLDEAARKLASLNGDPRSVQAFATMPIVIVAYSGGFGPTLSVLDRGGANDRIRGIVLMDALYAGMDKFASWIATHRSGFFVSAYTTHNNHRNGELQALLRERGISYGSSLPHDHLPGSVTFLPQGDISHRDFVNRAWAEGPLRDLLARLDNAPSVQTASNVFNPKTLAVARVSAR